ncbi:DUF4817 domain-containing protein [Trichonephila inaurata madagascariensis]|uniref:DUF4817 domain-containing protein n=1 Tax=Trichonephila inaurata madagascariensis TaxID=2747483 RepID=A0A8X7CQG0_9ARAC|nr:DUF4817 domain-containing protein [Trichonephila inaurata madagascariensis]
MGSVWPTANLHDTGRPRSGLTVAQADAVLHRVEKTPKYTTVRGLKPDDCQKRVASWLLQQQNTDNGFIAHILWTDEACFTLDGGIQPSKQPYVAPGQIACNPAAETSGTLVS